MTLCRTRWNSPRQVSRVSSRIVIVFQEHLSLKTRSSTNPSPLALVVACVLHLCSTDPLPSVSSTSTMVKISSPTKLCHTASLIVANKPALRRLLAQPSYNLRHRRAVSARLHARSADANLASLVVAVRGASTSPRALSLDDVLRRTRQIRRRVSMAAAAKTHAELASSDAESDDVVDDVVDDIVADAAGCDAVDDAARDDAARDDDDDADSAINDNVIDDNAIDADDETMAMMPVTPMRRSHAGERAVWVRDTRPTFMVQRLGANETRTVAGPHVPTWTKTWVRV